MKRLIQRIRGRLAARVGSAGRGVRSVGRRLFARAGDDARPVTPPAGEDPREALGARLEGFRERGKLRRRLGYLRRARELGYRDIGGLVFDLRRFGRDRPDLLEAKLAALTEIDRELRALEETLGARELVHDLREPGVASCPRCATLHGSDANFCPGCGLQYSGPRDAPTEAAAAVPDTRTPEAAAPAAVPDAPVSEPDDRRTEASTPPEAPEPDS
jgi:hypothetical protein